MICVDELHTIVENGESFRPDFRRAVALINKLTAASRANNPTLKVPLLVMSATLRIPDQQCFNGLLKLSPTMAN